MGLSLQEYIINMGTQKFCKLVGVTEQTAYGWKNKKNMPSPSAANELIELSHGLLSWASIYQPFFNEEHKPEHKEPIQTDLFEQSPNI